MPDLTFLRSRFFLLIPFAAFLTGLVPQESADPSMLVPFGILCIYTLVSGRLAEINLRDPILLSLLLLWLGWTWGSIFSSVPFASEVTLLVLAVLPLTYLCVMNRNALPTLYGIIAVVTILAVAAIAQVTFLPDAPWRARLFFADANTLGAMIALVIPLTVSFCFTHPHKYAKAALYACLVLLFAGLVATQSRSGLLGCIIGLIPVFWKNRKSLSIHSFRFILPIAAVLITGLLITSFGQRLLWAFGNDKDVLGRLSLWSSALQMAFISPLHGVGLGTFHLYYPPFKLLHDNSSGDWVHMDSLQWAVETGWVTAIVYYGLAAYVISRSLKKDLTQIQIGSGASLLTLIAIDHTSYILHVVPVLVICAILLSQFAAPYIQAPRYRYILTVSLMIVVLCGTWSLVRITPTLYFWTTAMRSFNAHDSDTYTKSIQKCIDFGDKRFPGCRIEAARLLIQTSSNPPEAVLIWLRDAEIANTTSPDIDWLRALYHMKNDPAHAELPIEELNRSLSKNPAFWQSRALLVRIYILQANYTQAYDTLKVAKNYWLEGNASLEYTELETEIQKKLKE